VEKNRPETRHYLFGRCGNGTRLKGVKNPTNEISFALRCCWLVKCKKYCKPNDDCEETQGGNCNAHF